MQGWGVGVPHQDWTCFGTEGEGQSHRDTPSPPELGCITSKTCLFQEWELLALQNLPVASTLVCCLACCLGVSLQRGPPYWF